MPELKQFDIAKAFALIEDKTGDLFTEFDSGYRSIVLKWLKAMQVDGSKKMLDIPENRANIFKMRVALDRYVNDFVYDHFASPEYLAGVQQGQIMLPEMDEFIRTNGKPGIREIPTYADAIRRLSLSAYKELNIDWELTAGQIIFNATENVVTESAAQRAEVARRLQDGLRRAETYDDVLTSLEDAGLTAKHPMIGPYTGSIDNMRRARAETTFRGITSEFHEALQQNLEQAMGEDNTVRVLAGPYPTQGRNGHRMCQDHYQEAHTKAEWQEIVRSGGYEGEAGLDADTMFIYGNNGYGCKHTYIVIHRDDLEQFEGQMSRINKSYQAWAAEENQRLAMEGKQ